MAKFREQVVSKSEKKFLIKGLEEWTRLDGRAFDEFRELDIQFGKDWGCCYVSLGKTKVLAQVSCEVVQPKSSRPSEGILNINLELNPMAAPHFEAGRQSEFSVQLNRLLEKCIKDSKTVDLESLCIKVNEKVWSFRVDINVLNHEGNILDCASVAALTALAHFRRPDVTWEGEDFVVHSYRTRDPIPTVIHHYPVCITYAVFENGKFILADPTLLEENVADTHITIGLNAYKELCGLHLGGKAELVVEVILGVTRKAAKRAETVISKIKEELEKDREIREKSKPVGFQYSLNVTEESDVTEEMTNCLDRWRENSKKKKQVTESKTEPIDADNQSEVVVESLGKGTAVLLPTEGTAEVWNISSEDDSEPEIIENTPVQEEAPLEISDDSEQESVDSEEESVIVINADVPSKTLNKKQGK